MPEGRIAQLSVSRGGVPKLPVLAARVGPLGLEGDAVKHTRVHGGPERALCLYSLERLRALVAEGHSPVPGALGENVTIEGLDWDEVRPGVRLALGPDVEVEVTRYTTPCSTISASFRDGDSMRIHEDRHPGWSRVYARVHRSGRLEVGMPVVRRAA